MNYTTKPASGLLVLAVLATVVLSACMPLPATDIAPGTQETAVPQTVAQPTAEAPAQPVPEPTETAVPEVAEPAAAGTSASPLEGPLWTLVSYVDENGETVDVLPGTEVTAQFQDGTVAGTAGCNNYFASYVVNGDQLAVELGGTTMMACDEAIMLQEAAYILNLAASSSFLVAGGELQITGADGRTLLTFNVLQPLPLVATTWQLAMYNNGEEALVSTLAGTKITAVFGADGSLSGSAGCNTYNASYTVKDSALTITAPATTRMMCAEPAGVMDQEAAYLATFPLAATYSILGDELEIADADGNTLLVFTPATTVPLAGVTWKLISFNDETAITSVILDTEITAVFGEDGSLTGSAGCNTYSAPFAVDGDKILIGSAATTRMMCAEPPGIMEQEAAYLAAIQKAAIYKADGERLDLFDADGRTIAIYNVRSETPPELSAEAGSAPAIIGAPWQWVATLYSDDTKAVPENPENYILELLPDGQLAVTADCNQATGTYSLDGDHISINIAAMTLAACPPGSLGDQFIRDLNASQSYLMDGEDLIIVLNLDTGTMRLEVPEAAPAVAPAVEPTAVEPEPLVLATPALELTPETGAGTHNILGVIWMWESYAPVDGDPVTVDSPEQYEFMLLPTGTIRVKADCNNGSGTFWIDGNNIAIEVLTLTRAACPPGSLSDDFVQALNQASTYQIDGASLNLELGENGGTMMFSPVE